jgi:quercetin dioxygenase-like cupin family protein
VARVPIFGKWRFRAILRAFSEEGEIVMTRFLCAATAILCGAGLVEAQEAGAAYTPGERVELAKAELPGAEGMEIAIQRVTFEPGWEGARHEHGGPVFVYVLDGELHVEVDGEDPKTLTAGELAQEPLGTPMVGKNLNAESPVTILLIQVSQEGVPLMTRVD